MDKDFFKNNIFIFSDLETSFDIKTINHIKDKTDIVKLDSFKDVKTNVYLTGLTYGTTYEECEQNYKYYESVVYLYKFIQNFLLDKDNISQDKVWCYFHNLNYDINFLIDDLLLYFKEFEFDIIGNKNKIVKFTIKNSKNNKEFNFIDSLNILRIKLANFDTGDYKIKKRSDLLVHDMSVIRNINHKAHKDEIEYLYYDVMTLCAGVFTYFQDKEFHLTTSSYSYKTFLKELKNKKLNKLFYLDKHGFLTNKGLHNLNLYNFNSLLAIDYSYRNLVYNLESYYKGGQTFINPKYQAKELKNVKVIDVNSLYPYAYLKAKVPIIRNSKSNLKKKTLKFNDNIRRFNNTNDIYNYISEVENKSIDLLNRDYFLMFTFSCTITLKKGLTFSPISSGFCDKVLNINEFIDDSVRNLKKADVVFKGSEYDLKNWLLYYDIENIVLIEYFIFDILKDKQKQDFENIMSEWIDQKEYYSQNQTYDNNKRSTYKLLMNSLTGKFGEKIRDYISYVDMNKLEIDEKYNEDFKTRYIMMIISLISYSRLYMSKNILKLKDNFVYCDTDSIALVDVSKKTIENNYKLDSYEVGLFDLEKVFDKAIYMKPKTYVGIMNNKTKFTVAGAKIDDKKAIEYAKNNGKRFKLLLNNNQVIGKKIIKVQAKKGIILLEQPFIFKEDNKKANKTLKNRRKSDVFDYIENVKYLASYQPPNLDSINFDMLEESDITISNDRDYNYDETGGKNNV